MNKIIRKRGRIILIENELCNKEHWLDLLESLTFKEGMAMTVAMSEWAIEQGLVKDEKNQ